MRRNYYNSKSSRSFQQARLEWRDLQGAWWTWSGRLHSTSRGAKRFIYRFIYRVIYQVISLMVHIEKFKLFSCYWSWMAVCTQGRYNFWYKPCTCVVYKPVYKLLSSSRCWVASAWSRWPSTYQVTLFMACLLKGPQWLAVMHFLCMAR